MTLCTAAGYVVGLTVVYAVLSQYAQSRRAYAVCAVVLMGVCALKRHHSRWFRMAECRLGQIAQWRRLWTALVGLLALGGSAIVALCTQIPAPKIHDRCMAECRVSLRCRVLDAAGVAAAGVGAAGRAAGGGPLWHLRLLESKLLGRSGCGDGWGVGLWWAATCCTLPAGTRCLTDECRLSCLGEQPAI